MRILYVEDNEVNRALVERVVRARQYTIVFRDEGEGALEILAEDPTIDLILLDIELAGTISGLEVIQTLRERNDHRPVVAITAYAMTGDRERILAAGCDQYLPKPLAIADLLNLLDRYQAQLAQKSAAPEPAATAAVSAASPSSPPPIAAVEVPAPPPESRGAAESSRSPEMGPARPGPEPPAPQERKPVIAPEPGQRAGDGRTPQSSQPT
jgi:CheY-like chemotaxis protein